MPRTKQTARRSTGGMAPRRQLATRAYSSSDDSKSIQETQIDIFKSTEKRTIVVEGTAELHESPNLIYLSFLVERRAPTLKLGMRKVIRTLGEIRSIARSKGVPNEAISSDSIGSTVEHSEYGYVKKGEKRKDDDEESWDKEAEEDFERTDYRVTHNVRSVLRICLEGDDAAAMFSRVSYGIISAGFRTHSPPIYELSNITELRHQAREYACANAKEKAARIVDALKDRRVTLGAPITLTDVHCDLRDDAGDSFLGNFAPEPHDRPRRFVGKPQDDELLRDPEDGEGGSGVEAGPAKKKARTEEKEGAGGDEDASVGSLDEGAADHIFVAPQIHIAARVKVIFEVDSKE